MSEATSAKPCAVCGKPRVAQYEPFCSRRCADVDLGRWLKGTYVIPGAPVEDEDDEAPPTAPRSPSASGD